MAGFQWLSLVCLAHGVSVARFKMNNSALIKHTFNACLSTHTADEYFLMRVLTEHLSVEQLIAAKGQAEGDHLSQVNHAA